MIEASSLKDEAFVERLTVVMAFTSAGFTN